MHAFLGRFLTTLAATFLSCTSLSAQVVEDTNIRLTAQGGTNYEVQVVKEPTPNSSNYTCMLFNIEITGSSTARLNLDGVCVDESSAWYVGASNQNFTADAIKNDELFFWGGFEETNVSVEPNNFEVNLNESFYVAVNTGQGFGSAPDFFLNRDHFGWAQWIVDGSGSLTMLDNAVAYNQGGIIIGENQAVPEPTSTLLLIGLGLLGTRRMRRTI